jgi:hypothetical protein
MFTPDAFFPVLERIAGVLNDCGVRFQVTGGLVSIYYSEPRLTQDVDLVVDPRQLQARLTDVIDALMKLGYLLNEAAIRDAVSRGRMFQIIDTQECLKIDLYPRELVPGALDRSTWFDVTPQLRLPFASRPDVVISKIVWISKGSHKSRRDVRQLMLRATADEIQAVRQFAEDLGLAELLDEVLAEPDEIDA